MQTPESPRTPPDRRNPRHPSPTASPTTPPIRAPPKRKHRKLSPSAKKKKAFTIGGFAKSALFGGGFGGHGGEDLRPLREAKGKKVLEEANAEDEEEEWVSCPFLYVCSEFWVEVFGISKEVFGMSFVILLQLVRVLSIALRRIVTWVWLS